MDILDDIEKMEESDGVQKRLETVIEWGSDKDWFDDKFIKSLLVRVKSGKDLTPKQLSAFENVEDMVRDHEDREDADGDCNVDNYGGDINHCDPDDIPF